MYSNEDISSLYSYLAHTPDGPLKKMLVGGEFTETHFRGLSKLAKSGTEPDCIDCVTAEGVGKMRMSSAEAAVKETFWPICKDKCAELGLLAPTAAKVA